jgi:hypothetical protein
MPLALGALHGAEAQNLELWIENNSSHIGTKERGWKECLEMTRTGRDKETENRWA